jgi:hypothetical protein
MLHFYLKMVAFTELDHLALASVCVYTACKIDYQHLQMISVAEHYYNQRKPSSLIAGVKKKIKSFEDVCQTLMIELAQIEVDLLTSIEFDLEFDLPVHYK